MKTFIAALILAATSVASAQWSVRPQAGLGYTTNANYEKTDTDSDFFWWVRASSTYTSAGSSWNLWLNYRDYLKEHQNDVFNYRVGRTADVTLGDLGNMDWDLALGGQQYLHDSPATTEESLNNVYLETSLRKTILSRQNLEFAFGPGYQIKFYPQFSGRTDHTILFNGEADWTFSPIQSLSPYAEIGFVASNQSLYSRNYFEVGGDWQIFPSQDLKYILHVMTKFSSFPGRKTTEETVVSSKNGRVRTMSQEETEAQTFNQVQASVVKMVKSAELRASVALNNQNTRSGLEDYSEMQVFGAVLIPLDSSRRRK